MLVAVLLAMWGLEDRASYFYTPADIAAGKAADGQAIRLGGMVEKGSIQRAARRRDDPLRRHRRQGADAGRSIAASSPTCSAKAAARSPKGGCSGGTFVADTILAKHDERYMPPELGNLAAEHKAGKTLRAMIAETGLAALWLAAGLRRFQLLLMVARRCAAAIDGARGRCARSRSCRAR